MNAYDCVSARRIHVGTMLILIFGILSLVAVGCSNHESLRIGFLGSISGRVNDLGISGLNGVRLAIDLKNRSGGIRGNQVELIEEDDQQTAEGTKAAFTRLAEKNVAAIVGPMTSSMAMTAVPLANASKIVLVSPTVSTDALSGKEDFFFRVIPSTSEFAQISANYYYSLGKRRIQAIYDLSNRAYTESWLSDFSREFRQRGGEVLPPISYTAGEKIDFKTLVQQALSQQPDTVLILGTSVETALFCQEIRLVDQNMLLGTTEWAATERLIALGGDNVEGIVIAQIIDYASQLASYQDFRNAYQKRFGNSPGFAALKGFDAANVVLAAMEQRNTGESLDHTLLRVGLFHGAQNPIHFDRYGDVHGSTWLYTVKNGNFVRLEKTRDTTH